VPGLEFQTLTEASGLPAFELPDSVEAIYGAFGLPDQVVYANFVASVDGVVAVPGLPKSSAIISGGSPADRFLVALLRACADAVVIGAGTFRAHGGPWTAAKAYPDAGSDFAELRRRLGLAPEPRLVVVTGSGHLDGAGPKLSGAIVATTGKAADRVRELVESDAEVMPIGAAGALNPGDVLTALSARGYRRILTEGGPQLMGQLLQARAVQELFLTVSPLLTGGGEPARPVLSDGSDLLSGGGPAPARLVSARAYESHLFLRYLLERG
jgi:riboflavin biosynthesis pyrimidine reductase